MQRFSKVSPSPWKFGFPIVDEALHRALRAWPMAFGTAAVILALGILSYYDYLPLGGAAGAITLVAYAGAGILTTLLFHRFGVSSAAYRVACYLESEVLFCGLSIAMLLTTPLLPVAWAFCVVAVMLHGQAVGRSIIAALGIALPPAIVAVIGWGDFSPSEVEMLIGGGFATLGAFLLIGSLREAQLDEAGHRRIAETALSTTQDVLEDERRVAAIKQQWLDTFQQSSSAMLLFGLKGEWLESFGEERILQALSRREWENIAGELLHEEALQRFGFALPGTDLSVDLRLVSLPGHRVSAAKAIVVQDATPRVDLEKRNKQLQERMVVNEKLASLGFLSAGIAHEINNPLAYISGNIEMLMHSPSNGSETLNALQDVKDGIQRILRIVNDLRIFAHDGTANRRTERTNVNDVLERVCRLIRLEAKQRTALTVSSQSTEVWVRMSEHRLHQVLLNLILNACQVFPRYRKENLVHVSIREEGRDVILQVSDNGPGISKSALRRVFDPFFTTKPPGEGTGLGLSVSYQLVRDAGGQVLLCSEKNKGTTFTLRLPMKKEEGASVLIVDDERRNVRLFERVLQPHYRVRTAHSLAEARPLLKDEYFDAVICDVRLGDGNGAELASDLSDDEVRRFLFLTALPEGHAELAGIPASSQVAYKPIANHELEALVRGIVDDEPALEYA